MPLLPRRRFLQTTADFMVAGVFLAAVPPLSAQGATSSATPPSTGQVPAPPEKPPPLVPDKVREIVSVSHRDLEAVRALVEADPLLVNASWDWGGGDFETPLQAAAHTGRREIAEFLLQHGARVDMFAAAMLGQVDFIRAVFAVNPRAAEIHGPHGFTLFHCAIQGGEDAQAVCDFLRTQGLTDVRKRPLPYATAAGRSTDEPSS